MNSGKGVVGKAEKEKTEKRGQYLLTDLFSTFNLQ
jgi:hypothetical protein